MGATAAPSPPPAGWTPVTPSETQRPTVKVKTAEPAPATEAPKPAETGANAEAEATEAPVETAPEQAAEAGTEPAEPGAYDKAKAAAEKARKGAAANRRLREQGLQLQRQLEQQSQHTGALEQQLREASQHLEHVMRDPLGFLKAKGVSPQDLAKRVALDGSPEGQIEALRAELQSTQQQLRAQADAARAREEATRVAQIENSYKQEAADATKYPHLASVHPDFILSRTKEIVTELWRKHSADPVSFRRATGYASPGDIPSSDFLTYLNDTYKPAAPKTAPAEAAPETSGKKTATITNKLASAKHAAPADFSKMSDRQQKKVMAEQFRQLGIGR